MCVCVGGGGGEGGEREWSDTSYNQKRADDYNSIDQ